MAYQKNIVKKNWAPACFFLSFFSFSFSNQSSNIETQKPKNCEVNNFKGFRALIFTFPRVIAYPRSSTSRCGGIHLMKSFLNQVKVFLLVVETFTFENDHRSNHRNLSPDSGPCIF